MEKDIFQKDSLYNDGLNNLVGPLEPSSNDANNPFSTTTTENFDTIMTNDLIRDKNNIELFSLDGESEYHYQNNQNHHSNDNDIHKILDHHNDNDNDNENHNIEILHQKIDDDRLVSSFETDMGPETSVDITDDVMMMATENSEITDLLEHSALSHSKETLPSSDNINPFEIKNSIHHFGSAAEDIQQHIEDLPTGTLTPSFEELSSIVPMPPSEIEQFQNQQQEEQYDQLITNNNDEDEDGNINENSPFTEKKYISDKNDEIDNLTNKFDSVIVHDKKENEEKLIDNEDYNDEKEKDVVENEYLGNKNVGNLLETQNNKHEDEILKYDHFIENTDAIREEKQEKEEDEEEKEEENVEKQQQQCIIEDSEYVHHNYDSEYHYIADNKENECNKENEYITDDICKNNRITEKESVREQSVIHNIENNESTLIDEQILEQQEQQFENISMKQSFSNDNIEDNFGISGDISNYQIHENSANEEILINEKHFDHDQELEKEQGKYEKVEEEREEEVQQNHQGIEEEFNKYNLGDKEDIEFSKNNEFVFDNLQQYQQHYEQQLEIEPEEEVHQHQQIDESILQQNDSETHLLTDEIKTEETVIKTAETKDFKSGKYYFFYIYFFLFL